MAGDRDRVIIAEVISKCWSDAAYGNKFMNDPKKCLQEAGMEVSDKTEVEVFRSDNRVTYLGIAGSMNPDQYFNQLKTQLSSMMPIPPHHEVRLVQSGENYLPIIIPVLPKTYVSGQLSEKELAAVAGGSYTYEAVNVATTGNAVAEANAAAVANVAAATEAAVAAEAGAVAVAVIAVVLI